MLRDPAVGGHGGDADIATVAALIGERARARVLMALADGRALPASVLAAEAGVAASTASEHLGHLVGAGLLTVERQGRARYFRLAGPEVAEALEALARISPPETIRSLRQGTRAHALRRARTCYNHLAGRLAVAVMSAMLDHGLLAGGDGRHHPFKAGTDRLSAPGTDLSYRLTHRVAAPEALDDEVEALVARMVAKPGVALAMGEALFYRQIEVGIEAAYEDAGATMACNMMDSSALEGVQAFIEKRPPSWPAVQGSTA